MTKRIIIPGSRSFQDYALMERVLDKLLPPYGDDIEIVSGHADGVDQFGERYAREHQIRCAVFPARWDEYGRSAGPIRNSQMIDYARQQDPVVIAFWNGKSRGTLDTLVKAQNAGIPTTVVICDKSGIRIVVRYSYVDDIE